MKSKQIILWGGLAVAAGVLGYTGIRYGGAATLWVAMRIGELKARVV